jgi:prephenate dehydrogenase
MRKYDRVAIIGVGLIGGSIGLAMQRRGLAGQVVGIGRRQSTLRIARRVGAVSQTTIDLAKGVAGASLVVVCSTVGKIVEHVRLAAEHAPDGTLITDAGSTKAVIVKELRQLPRKCRFVGSHPFAGSEKSGPAHADADLFSGRLAIVTPTGSTRAEDCGAVEQFWSALGALVVRMSPAEHDRVLSLTSHLPHAVAAALAATVPQKHLELIGTGFLDTSRLASGSPEIWSQIFTANRRNVTAAIDRFQKQLAALRAAILKDDSRQLERFLTLAKNNRDAVGS